MRSGRRRPAWSPASAPRRAGPALPAGRGLLQPPVQMHLVLDLAGLRIDPLAAALDHDGGRTEQGFELDAGRTRALIALRPRADAFEDVVGLGVVVVLEGADRRGEHRGLVPVRRLLCRDQHQLDRTRDRPAGATGYGPAARSCRCPRKCETTRSRRAATFLNMASTNCIIASRSGIRSSGFGAWSLALGLFSGVLLNMAILRRNRR